MEATTARRHTAHPMSYYQNMVKDMERNVRDAFFAIYAIERSLPQKKISAETSTEKSIKHERIC